MGYSSRNSSNVTGYIVAAGVTVALILTLLFVYASSNPIKIDFRDYSPPSIMDRGCAVIDCTGNK